MHNISRILLILLAVMASFFLGCKKSSVKILNAISSHNLKIKLVPDEHKLIAIDTLQIEYREETNTVYFFLHQSLQIEKICVGNQKLNYEIIPHRNFEQFKKAPFIKDKNDTNQVNFYKVSLPKTLFPQNIQIWYQGFLTAENSDDLQTEFDNFTEQEYCSIDQNRIYLPGEKFWYPSLPDSKASYKLMSLTPAGFPIKTSGSLIFHEQRNDSLISIWEQKLPIKSITITANNVNTYNNFDFKNNYRTYSKNNRSYYASNINYQNKNQNFYYTQRIYSSVF